MKNDKRRSNFINTLRQYKYPEEFRIFPEKKNEDINIGIADLNNLIAETAKAAPSQGSQNENEINKFIVELATNVWRLKGKMFDKLKNEPFPEMRRAYRHLDSIMLTLENSGIEIIDHTGGFFDPNGGISALAFQPEKGLTKETVIETIKPSIFKNKIRIQMGEVIVGTPS